MRSTVGSEVFETGKVSHIALSAEAYRAVLVYTWMSSNAFDHRLQASLFPGFNDCLLRVHCGSCQLSMGCQK